AWSVAKGAKIATDYSRPSLSWIMLGWGALWGASTAALPSEATLPPSWSSMVGSWGFGRLLGPVSVALWQVPIATRVAIWVLTIPLAVSTVDESLARAPEVPLDRRPNPLRARAPRLVGVLSIGAAVAVGYLANSRA